MQSKYQETAAELNLLKATKGLLQAVPPVPEDPAVPSASLPSAEIQRLTAENADLKQQLAEAKAALAKEQEKGNAVVQV